MALQVEALTFEMIAVVRPVVARVRRYDRSLADQLVRAASSVALNIAEADASDAGNQRARFCTAAGSASEVRAALRVATAWGYVAPAEAEPGAALLNRIVPMSWKLARK
jgi:four helix bundle protein